MIQFDPWVRKIPWRRKQQPTPVLLPGKSHGQRSLAGYSPWGCKELDRTEHIRTHAHTHTHLSFGLNSSLKLKWPLSSFAPSVQFQVISSCSCLSACQDLTDERMFYAFSISFVPLTDINHQMPRSGKHGTKHQHKLHFQGTQIRAKPMSPHSTLDLCWNLVVV